MDWTIYVAVLCIIISILSLIIGFRFGIKYKIRKRMDNKIMDDLEKLIKKGDE